MTVARPFTPRLILYLVGLGGSALGDAVYVVTLPFAVFNVLGHHDAVTLAHVMTAAFLPRFLGLLWGSVIDRLDLKLIFVVSGLTRLVMAAGLGALFLFGHASLPLIFGAVFLNGLLTVLSSTSGSVLVPQLVPKAVLTQTNSVLQAVNMGLPLLGYGLGGALVATTGIAPSLFVSALCFGVMPAVVLFMQFPERRRLPGRGQSLWQGVREGFSYLARQQMLLLLGLTALLVNLTAVVLNITVPVLMERLGRGAAGYGLYEIILSAGMLLGVALSNLRPVQEGRLTNVYFGLLSVALGVCGGAFVLVPVVYAGAALMGIGFGMLTVSVISYFQTVVPSAFLGRVMGTLNSANAVGYIAGSVGTAAFLGVWSSSLLFLVLSAIDGVLLLTLILLARTSSLTNAAAGGDL